MTRKLFLLCMIFFLLSSISTVAIADTFVVIFGEDESLVTGVSYTVTETGVVRNLICDLDSPGASYDVYKGGNAIPGSPYTVDQDGTIYFETTGGGNFAITMGPPPVDTTPPTILSVSVLDIASVDVTFSEPVEASTAQDTGNYSIDPSVAVNSASLDADTVTVHLATDLHAEGSTYTLSVSNVQDRAPVPNTILPGSSAQYVVPNLVPSAPTGLSGAPGDGSVALSWNANPEPDIAGYKVYYGDSSIIGPYLDEDFEDAPSDPAGWEDTGAGNSQATDDSLFQTFSVGGSTVFGTISEATNIHSHFIADDSINWSDYEYSGRMRITDAQGGGVGVTFLSHYPNDQDLYYRLRTYSGNAFHVSPHGTSITGGSTNTGVVPQANTWYLFRIQAEDTGTQTNIRARVWQEGGQEPTAWQVDCYDSSTSRLTNGAVGLWSMSTGSKYWDDLQVVSLSGGGGPVYEPPIDVGDVTAYNLTGLTNDVEYRVAVSAYDAQSESALSSEILVTPSGGGPIDTTPPQFGNINIVPSKLSAQMGYDTTTISFSVSEALQANPSVQVGGNSATYSSNDGNDYTYTYTATGTETEGFVDVTFSGTDEAGNPGTATCQQCLEFDFTPPDPPGDIQFD